MRSVCVRLLMLATLCYASAVPELAFYAKGGYVQKTSGTASFTSYSGCSVQPACGIAAAGFTAAISQLAFGAAPGLGAGDACGRCFAITATKDPYSPGAKVPLKTIVVKVTDLCPVAGNQEWCSQTRTHPVNKHGAAVNFDLCEDTGAAAAFFPGGEGAYTGTYKEVSCSQWRGYDGKQFFHGACLSGEGAGKWPATGCGNKGHAP